MLLGVISDVHGNVWALEAALDALAREGVDRIVNLGDTVYGPLDPGATATLLQRLAIPTVRGNQDRQLLEAGEEPDATTRFVLDELSPDQVAWIATFPPHATVEGVCLFHGTPDDDEGYLLEKVTRSGSVERPAPDVARILGSDGPGTYACGHTHVPRTCVLDRGGLVVNPGSVGLPAYSAEQPVPHRMEAGSPHARFAIVDLGGASPTARLLTVPYAWEHAARRADQAGRPDWAVALRTGRAR